jgi:hypothetical protein
MVEIIIPLDGMRLMEVCAGSSRASYIGTCAVEIHFQTNAETLPSVHLLEVI